MKSANGQYLPASFGTHDVNVAAAGAVRVENGLSETVDHLVHLDGGLAAGSVDWRYGLVVLEDHRVAGDRGRGKLAVFLVVYAAREGTQPLPVLPHNVKLRVRGQVELAEEDGDADGRGGLDHGPPDTAPVLLVGDPLAVPGGHVELEGGCFSELERAGMHELLGLGRLQQRKVVHGGEGDDGARRQLGLVEARRGEPAVYLHLPMGHC